MFSLLNGFYEYYTRRPSFNILIIGLDSSGKTTLLEQVKRILTNKTPSKSGSISTVPTVGLNVSKCDLKGIQCQFWDLGGGGDLPKLWPKYYKEAHAVLFVIDSFEFQKSDDKRKRLKDTFIEFVGNEDVEGVPVAVLANKQDLIGDEDVDSVIRVKETFNPLMERIEARESKVFGVSALTGNGVMEALEWTLSAVEKNCDFRPPNFI